MAGSARQIFWRGLKMRCPRCGTGPIFRRWYTYTEYTECPRCALPYDPRGESLAFMYLSTAFLTGVMFIVLILVPPSELATYRIGLAVKAILHCFEHCFVFPARDAAIVARRALRFE